MRFFKRIIQFWKTGLTLLVILTLCLIPAKDLNKIDLLKLSYEDLVVHLIMFISFSTVLYYDLRRNIRQLQNPVLLPVLVFSMSALMGVFTEMLQFIFVSLHRTASLTDLIFDLIGASLGLIYVRIIKQ